MRNPDRLREFHDAERMFLLKNVDLREVLKANGFAIMTGPKSTGKKFKHSSGMKLALGSDPESGIQLAYDYINKKGYTAWNFLKGSENPQETPVLNRILKQLHLRRFGIQTINQKVMMEFYKGYKDSWKEIVSYENIITEVNKAKPEKRPIEIRDLEIKESISAGLSI